MLRNLSGPIVKALLLGFFCCLGASAKDEIEPEPKGGFTFALREVHPNNTQILAQIKSGEAKLPPGYKIYQIRISDPETGKITDQEPIVLASKAIVTGTHIEKTSPGHGLDTLNVRLNKEGGKRLGIATKRMALGRARIAIVFEGQCIIAPTVNGVLGERFVVEGLQDKQEVSRVVKVLNEKRKK